MYWGGTLPRVALCPGYENSWVVSSALLNTCVQLRALRPGSWSLLALKAMAFQS